MLNYPFNWPPWVTHSGCCAHTTEWGNSSATHIGHMWSLRNSSINRASHKIFLFLANTLFCTLPWLYQLVKTLFRMHTDPHLLLSAEGTSCLYLPYQENWGKALSISCLSYLFPSTPIEWTQLCFSFSFLSLGENKIFFLLFKANHFTVAPYLIVWICQDFCISYPYVIK